MYLLDTNVVSELRRPRPHGAVVAWDAAADEDDLYVSAGTLGELQAGVERIRDQDGDKAKAIERWIDDVAASYGVLAFDHAAARVWARLMHRRPRAISEDGMIAATAVVHRLRVVTRSIRDFRPFGVEMIDPFAARG